MVSPKCEDGEGLRGYGAQGSSSLRKTLVLSAIMLEGLALPVREVLREQARASWIAAFD